MNNNWYVLTGGPSSGKTTLIKEFERLGYTVVHEVATHYIKEQLTKGITIEEMLRDHEKFQRTILLRQLELEKSLDPQKTIILDRGVHDHYGYLEVRGIPNTTFTDLESTLVDCYYKKVFIVDLLPFQPDEARMESAEEGDRFAKKVEQEILRSYKSRGLDIVRLPVMSVRERMTFIEEHITHD
ncbi:ATP-binding protein [soil metagenome]